MQHDREAFEIWHESVYDEWWKDHKAPLRRAWETLEEHGVDADVIVETFSAVASAIKDQYGD